MLNGLKAEWRRFRSTPMGHRFVACHERHQAREAPWLKPILFFAAIFSLVIGIILAFIPGPAILFFAISGALLAAESRMVATTFDKVEAWGHPKIARLLRGRKHSDPRATTKALTPQAAAVIAARAEVIRKEQSKEPSNAEPQRAAVVPPQRRAKTTAKLRRPRKAATKPSIRTLPPPVIIGREKA